MRSITDQIIDEIYDNPEFETQLKRQCELEEKMRGMGIDRFWNDLDKAKERNQETQAGSVRRLMNHSIDSLADGIKAFVAEAVNGKAGRKNIAAHLLKLIEPDAAAVLTLRVVLDGISREALMVPLARRISMMIEDELAFRAFARADKNAHDLVVKREKSVNGSDYRRQRHTMFHNMEARGITWKSWDVTEHIHVGSKLIELMMETTGLIQVKTYNVDVKKQEVRVEATPETIKWLEEENNRCEAMAPVYLPTIIPPKPWTSPFDGGYWSGRVRRLALVKTYSKQYLAELAEHDMPEVYDAINAMQHTAWSLNPQMLEVVRTLWNNGSVLGDIPSADDYPLPAKPDFLNDDELEKDDWTPEQLESFRNWKRSAVDTYAMNAKLKSLRLQFAKVLYVAELFANEEAIYFPHQMDFRGRAYAVPLFLNPQGSDVAKGLLQFANGVPITDLEGESWLAIHGANSYGNDKVSLEDRHQWVLDNEDVILQCAADPYGCHFWCDADKPFQFLAFCFDWAGLRAEGYGYISHLPVQMDGSCNGLQNFSAMLRDPIGGKAVNLIPSELPADIYQSVADLVKAQVMKDAACQDDEAKAALARGWLQYGITRKVCKRPVMTLAYGAKEFGFNTQVYEDTVLPYKYQVAPEAYPWANGWAAASYMGGLIWECVGQVVVAARQAMDWLQAAAKAASKEGLPVRWETPDSLVVLQAYPKLLTKRVRLTFQGVERRLTAAVGVDKELDVQRQANGISPNWVHSMDASHLRATVRRGFHEGIRSFALVHDSYGTHAGNAWALAEFLRDEFIKMYSGDVLASFRDELSYQLPPKTTLAPLPPKGTLDLELIRSARYFFA